MRETYYVFRQTRYPNCTIQKCGFRQSYWTSVSWSLPRRKKGSYLLARSNAFAKKARIIARDDNYIIYKDENGILNAVSKTKDIPNSFAGF